MRKHRSRLMLAASALALSAGTAFAAGLETESNVTGNIGIDGDGNGVHVDVGTDADVNAGAVLVPLLPRAQPGAPTTVESEAGAGVTLTAPVQPGAEIVADPQPDVPATLSAWTPDDLVGASVVNETGMRIATVDGVAADASGTVKLILAIDAQPGAKRAVPFDRFDLGTSGGALLLVGASDADLVGMADYQASAGAYTPITTDAQLQSHLQTAAGN